MKILFNNKINLNLGTFSCINPNVGYSVDNLAHIFLEKRFQSTSDTDTITYTFNSSTSLSSIFWGYTNASEIEFRFYDSGDVLLHTETFSTISIRDAAHFDSINVKYIEIDITTLSTYAYLGGIAGGDCMTMPDVVAQWVEDVIDNSYTTDSPSGQSTQNYITPLDAYNFNIRDIDRDTAIEIKDLFKASGIGRTLWIDLFEENHDYILPMYSKITGVVAPIKNTKYYNLNLKLREAK